jgi:predicted membrane protein
MGMWPTNKRYPTFWRWYFKYHFVSLLVLLPTYAINLGIVYLFVAILKTATIWIISSVVIGDIIAYELNVAFGVWLQIHWSYLQRLQFQATQLKQFRRTR